MGLIPFFALLHIKTQTHTHSQTHTHTNTHIPWSMYQYMYWQVTQVPLLCSVYTCRKYWRQGDARRYTSETTDPRTMQMKERSSRRQNVKSKSEGQRKSRWHQREGGRVRSVVAPWPGERKVLLPKSGGPEREPGPHIRGPNLWSRPKHSCHG